MFAGKTQEMESTSHFMRTASAPSRWMCLSLIHIYTLPVRGIRPVAALAPGVSGDTGLTLRQLAAAMVDAVRPAALILSLIHIL